MVELAGRSASTWLLNGGLPGATIRARKGRRVRIVVENGLPQETSIHWHGIRLKNRMDGVAGVTQPPIAPGGRFVYDFIPPDAGTFFYHSHVGLQLDRGIYGPLIIEDAGERVDYDEEAVIILDDWLDGINGTPEEELAILQEQAKTQTMMPLTTRPPGLMSRRWLGYCVTGDFDKGDVSDYAFFLIAGQPPQSPSVVTAARGKRVRLRIINSGADTTFAFFVEGETMTVTHADSVPVKSIETGALVLGPGERWDATVVAGDGVRRMIGVPLGKIGLAMAVMRPPGARAKGGLELKRFTVPSRVISYGDLESLEGPGLGGTPRVIELPLGRVMGAYEWLIGGKAFPDAPPVKIGRGERVRFVVNNMTDMIHPMHLHGHFFRLGGPNGPVTDTFLTPPRRTSSFDWIANNPGHWAFHCHNDYHLDAGMFRVIEVG